METEVKELTVRPWGEPSVAATVATATPVANWAQAARKSSRLRAGDIPKAGEGALDKSINLILS